MDPIDQLVQDVLSDKVDVNQLGDEELELVFDRMQDVMEELLDGPHHEAAVAILDVLSTVIDTRIEASDMSCFEKAIAEAEARGSVYWEFETYSVH